MMSPGIRPSSANFGRIIYDSKVYLSSPRHSLVSEYTLLPQPIAQEMGHSTLRDPRRASRDVYYSAIDAARPDRS